MAAQKQLEKLKSDLNKKLHEDNKVTNVLAQVETKTGVDRLYLVGGVAALVALYLIFGHFAELLCNGVSFLYPAFVSIKAIETATKDDDTQWLTYWVVFALFNVFEFASDEIVGWFPIYWLVKCAVMLWLYLPMTRGAQMLYMRVIRPFMVKNGPSIDKRLQSAMGTVTDTVRDNVDMVKDHLHEQ